jgi:hypothetical protein
MNRNRRFPAVAVAATLTAALMLTVAAPTLGHHRPGHGAHKSPAPTPLATASPQPTATPAPTPTVETTATPAATPTPEPSEAQPSTEPTATPTSYPIVYSDEYWAFLAEWPLGYAPNQCYAFAGPGTTCSDYYLPYWFYPDGSSGYDTWYVDPTSPDGWSIDVGSSDPGDFEGY